MARVSLISFGEVLDDWVPTPVGFDRRAGGAPLNMAAEARAFGLQVSIMTCLGEDEASQRMRRVIIDQGLEADLVFTDSEAVLAHTEVQVDPNTGERQFIFFKDKASFAAMRTTMLKPEMFNRSGFFHCGTVCLINDDVIACQRRAVELARRAGMVVTFDPNFRPTLFEPGVQEALAKDFLALADIAKLSEEEVGSIVPGGDVETLLKEYPNLTFLLLTKGSEGMELYLRNGSRITTPGVKPRRVADTVGCGDVSFGAFIGRLGAQGLSDTFSLRRATEAQLKSALACSAVAGALQVERKGGLPVPNLGEIRELAKARKVELGM